MVTSDAQPSHGAHICGCQSQRLRRWHVTDGQASSTVLGHEPGSLTLRGSPGAMCSGSVGKSTVSPFSDVPLT